MASAFFKEMMKIKNNDNLKLANGNGQLGSLGLPL